MPAKIKPSEFRWRDDAEREQIKAQAAKAGYSLGNYVRVKLGLEPLEHGGYRGNSGRPPAKSKRKGHSLEWP
ncbi:MAG TPA: hypothetical protein VEF04_20065 [Blastocatellia bacterium]|nr:hypothetical protein [Blastocatellia bacterium]